MAFHFTKLNARIPTKSCFRFYVHRMADMEIMSDIVRFSVQLRSKLKIPIPIILIHWRKWENCLFALLRFHFDVVVFFFSPFYSGGKVCWIGKIYWHWFQWNKFGTILCAIETVTIVSARIFNYRGRLDKSFALYL